MIILNNVLAYAAYGVATSTSDHTKEACVDFFSSEEIIDARDLLWGKCENGILPKMIKRQNTTTKKGLLLTTSDIIEAIQKLGDSGSMPIFAVEFSSLGRLPLAKPSEKCPISLCERMAKLEARVGECESAMTETNCAIASMQSKISYASIAMQPAGPAPPGQQRVTPRQRQVPMESTSQNGLATGSNSEPRDPSAAVRPKSHSNVMQPPRGGGFHPQARTSSVWSLESAASKSDAPTEGFEFDAREKRRRMRRRRSAITGKKKADECRLKGAPAPKRTRDIFVYQVENSMIAADLEDYMKECGVEPNGIKKVSHPEAQFSSYRVTVEASNLGTVLRDDFWPEYVCVRIFRGKLREDADAPRRNENDPEETAVKDAPPTSHNSQHGGH